jgi:hypothetical protein
MSHCGSFSEPVLLMGLPALLIKRSTRSSSGTNSRAFKSVERVTSSTPFRLR